jgi:hypothetical protein
LIPKLSRQLKEVGILYPTNEIIITTPYIYSTEISSYWKTQLDEFEKLINSIDTSEHSIQIFFERNPNFLTGLNYKDIISQPTLEYSEGSMQPDFLLCPHKGFYGDILELKLPKEQIIAGRKNRIKFSSKVEDVIAQVRHYRDYFQDESNRTRVLKKYGITAYKPKVSIVIGKTPSMITYEEYLDLKIINERDRIAIITYDDMFEQMKLMASNY